MATVLGEKWDSRTQKIGWKNHEATYLLLLAGTEDDSDIISTAETWAADDITPPNGLLLQDYDIDHMGGGNWLVSFHYSRTEPKKPGDSTYSFDTGGGTTKITQSISTIASYAPVTGTAPDYQGAIGVTADGIDGCEIVSPTYNFSETHYIAVADVTDDYKAALFAATGKTNNATWRTFDEGEVLFLGASGTQRGVDDWEITYKFAASENATSIAIGNAITVSAKKGWEYLWVRYEEAVDSMAVPKSMIKKPTFAYVEQVYKSADFTTLGIGS